MRRLANITQSGVTVGEFDPTSVVTTFSVRLFLPETW